MREMSNQQRTILFAAVAAIAGFAIGALWQYSSARNYAQRLDGVETEYEFKRLEATLGAATIEAQRGSFEIARQLASDFFGGLQSSIDRAPTGQQQAFRDILLNRDAMITSLSRADQQSGSMLAQLFTRYRIARGEPVGPEPGAVAPSVTVPADTPAPPNDGTP